MFITVGEVAQGGYAVESLAELSARLGPPLPREAGDAEGAYRWANGTRVELRHGTAIEVANTIATNHR